jgi:HD-like signal output (HDOD) protein
MMSEDARLQAMREKLGSSGLPVFARTVREVTSVATSSASSADDLSDVIGKDASMSARLIRVANSPMFNLQNRQIDTISAAVVLTGFDAVRELAVSVSVIEQMLKGRQHAKVAQHMARAFHAAAQAKAFAVSQGDECPEEVFVAALLKEVGEMAFWSADTEESVELEARLANGEESRAAEKAVLGYELSKLSGTLAEEWSLGELLAHLHGGLHTDDPRIQNIELAHEVAKALESAGPGGWAEEPARSLLADVAKHLDRPIADVQAMVQHNLDEAGAIAQQYGVPKIEENLPRVTSTPAPSNGASVNAASAVPPERDAVRQLEVFREVADGLEQGASLDVLMAALLNGIREGLAFDRAYFALLSPDRKQLLPKYTSGCKHVLNARSLGPADPLRDVLNRTAAVRVPRRGDDTWLDDVACIGLPIHIAGKTIGVLYAGRPYDEVSDEDLSGLRAFGQQVVLVLSQAANG